MSALQSVGTYEALAFFGLHLKQLPHAVEVGLLFTDRRLHSAIIRMLAVELSS